MTVSQFFEKIDTANIRSWQLFLTLTLDILKMHSRDFPGGPVAGTLCSQRRGPGFEP